MDFHCVLREYGWRSYHIIKIRRRRRRKRSTTCCWWNVLYHYYTMIIKIWTPIRTIGKGSKMEGEGERKKEGCKTQPNQWEIVQKYSSYLSFSPSKPNYSFVRSFVRLVESERRKRAKVMKKHVRRNDSNVNIKYVQWGMFGMPSGSYRRNAVWQMRPSPGLSCPVLVDWTKPTWT